MTAPQKDQPLRRAGSLRRGSLRLTPLGFTRRSLNFFWNRLIF
jgi:hypothetical protein